MANVIKFVLGFALIHNTVFFVSGSWLAGFLSASTVMAFLTARRVAQA